VSCVLFTDSDIRPPPIIHHGPQNQTLPISSMAVLQCAVSGDPAPTVRWYKNGRLLTLAGHRFLLRDTGSLQIGGQSATSLPASLPSYARKLVAIVDKHEKQTHENNQTQEHMQEQW